MLNEPDGDSCGATQPPTCCFYRTPNDAEAVCAHGSPTVRRRAQSGLGDARDLRCDATSAGAQKRTRARTVREQTIHGPAESEVWGADRAGIVLKVMNFLTP